MVASPSKDVSGIILAGGTCRRMKGVNKALLEVGGRPIVERVAAALRELFSEVVLVTNSPDEYRFLNLPLYTDIKQDRGSLGGLYTGLTVISAEYGFLSACDMPFLDRNVILRMLRSLPDHDVVVPNLCGRMQPLHAIYSRKCLPHIEPLLDSGDLMIVNLFPKVRVIEIPEAELMAQDPELLFAMNVNTPEELEKAREISRRVDRG